MTVTLEELDAMIAGAKKRLDKKETKENPC